MTYLILLVAASFNAAANFFLKLTSGQETSLLSLKTLQNPNLYLAVGLFALNIIGYALFLQRTNLSIGYPIYVGVTFILVLGLSFLMLRETLSIWQGVGVLLILAGVVLASVK